MFHFLLQGNRFLFIYFMLVLTEFCICIYCVWNYTVKPYLFSPPFLLILSSVSSCCSSPAVICQGQQCVKGCICVWECVPSTSTGVHEGVCGCSQVKKWHVFPADRCLCIFCHAHIKACWQLRITSVVFTLFMLTLLRLKWQVIIEYSYCALTYYPQYNVI